MSIELQVIGCFGLRVDGLQVDVSPVPARVLACLALAQGTVCRSVLAGTLWPQVPHERALGNLRSALWRLPEGTRRGVAECDTRLGLSADVRCDLSVVPAGGRAPDALTLQDVLTRSWRDELLSGWYDDWVLEAREALQERRALLLEELALASGTVGHARDALTYATLAVGVQPLRESAQRALLRAHLDLGHVREAVELHREFTAMLMAELGVEPGPETRALMAQELAAQELAAQPGVARELVA